MGHQPGQPLLGGTEREDPQSQRVAGQTAAQGEHVVAAGPQLLGDVGHHPRVRGRGGGEDRSVGRQRGEQVADPPVVRPEVVTPVADAVRLVDDEEPTSPRQAGQLLLAEPRVVEPLRADEQQVDLVGGESLATSAQSSALAEFIVTARIPARSAADTWSRIRASSGDTITVGPAPAARSRAVATM